MTNEAIQQVNIKKCTQGATTDSVDQLAIEDPLEIQLQYGPRDKPLKKNIAVTMRTPGMDEALAAGFLCTEGIVQHAGQIYAIEHPGLDPNRICVILQEDMEPQLQQLERNFYTTSSCGVCGKSSIDSIRTVTAFPATNNTVVVTASVLNGLPAVLQEQQSIFERTGGLHAAALFTTEGTFITLCEDVGRHNALDKLLGGALLKGELPLSNCILLLSGRASFELLQKATMAGLSIVAAIGAPSSLAVQLAAEASITLVGFLRNGNFNIYAEPQRIIQ